uniref:Protein EAN57-like protein n=3 Tax=Callorhinchus milii TaxID=7868 RepID=A0A4W3JZT5_CALMI
VVVRTEKDLFKSDIPSDAQPQRQPPPVPPSHDVGTVSSAQPSRNSYPCRESPVHSGERVKIHPPTPGHTSSQPQTIHLRRATPFCSSWPERVSEDGQRSTTPQTHRSENVDDLIPNNIKHKFGSKIVNELLTQEEIEKFWAEKDVEENVVPSAEVEEKPQKPAIDPLDTYESLSFPLRHNLFPGAPTKWKSLARDSYTQEVHHRFQLDMDHWHGRRTDELGQWVEKNIIHERMKKALGELRKGKNAS